MARRGKLEKAYLEWARRLTAFSHRLIRINPAERTVSQKRINLAPVVCLLQPQSSSQRSSLKYSNMGSVSNSSPSHPIPPSAMPLISPSALLHAHLSQSPPLRPSNRLPTEARPINLNIRSLTHTNGSSLAKIGATTIVCGVRAEILPVSEIPSFRVNKGFSSEPTRDGSEEENDEGEGDEDIIYLHHLLVPNLELSTGCSPLHPANTAPSVEAQSISQRLFSLLHSSKLVRLSDLEITYTPESTTTTQEAAELGLLGEEEGPQLKAYWVLYIDMLCLSHGGTGSVFDAAWLALYAALRDTVLPKAGWDGDEKRVFCSAEMEEARKLGLRGMPVALSFGVFVPEKRSVPDEQQREAGVRLLVDLDTFEEECVEERACVVVDVSDGEEMVHRIEKSGGGRVGMQEVQEMLRMAGERWREWRIVLEKAMKEAG